MYREEIELNDWFNNFVRNYELAYWGPNTATHQIGSPVKKSKLNYQCSCITLNATFAYT